MPVFLLSGWGLGSPAALYLAAAGAGTLLLADDDDLHISNLQRQILYRSSDTGISKAKLAAEALRALNPSITLHAISDRIPLSAGDELPARPTLVLDCSDNLATRHRLNAWCFSHNLPLITASAIGFHGQLLVLTPPGSTDVTSACGPTPVNPNVTAAIAVSQDRLPG